MNEKSPEKKLGFSKFHIIFILIGIVVVIIIGMVLLPETEDEKEAVCGEDCHQENYMGYNNPQENSFMAVHVENEVECWDCHLGEEVENKFHAPHGEITAKNCQIGCHGQMDWKIEAPLSELIWHPYTDNGSNIGNLKNLKSCVSCHDPRTNSMGLGAETCVLCHDITSDELESHGEDTCSISPCHSESPEMTVDKTGHINVEGHCSLCHNKAHPEDAFVYYDIVIKNETFSVESSFCESCHNESANSLNITGGSHEVNMCIQCHTEHDNSLDCTGCHLESELDHPSGESYGDCKDCHITGGHEPKNLEFPTSKSQVLSDSFCSDSSCHADVYNEIELELDGKLHGQEDFDEDCIQCHETHSENVPCFSCHDRDKEPDHDILEPFDDCTECHVSGHDNGNITFTNFNETELTSSFCEVCHEGVAQEIMIKIPEHALISCQVCHEDARGEAITCDSCHVTGKAADPPDHSAEIPFNDCEKCHDTAHDPGDISSFDVDFSNNDFCASCHSDEPLNQYTIYSQYGANHTQNFVKCTSSCHSGHNTQVTCTSSICHEGINFPASHYPYKSTECQDCHRSTHDPTNSAPRPGSSLSQKEYMENYFVFDKVRLKNTFSWQLRGNHNLVDPCDLCHDSAILINYTDSSLPLLNLTGADCAQGCHKWVDLNTTQDPFVLLNSSITKHNSEIFNNASRGGCVGYCHQKNPSLPDLNGSKHGVITNCLDAECHEDQFEGGNQSQTHRDHEKGLEDAQVNCFSVCHTDMDGDHSDCIGCHSHYAQYGRVPYSEKLVAGGCYGCHKSGHDPALLPDGPCKDCH